MANSSVQTIRIAGEPRIGDSLTVCVIETKGGEIISALKALHKLKLVRVVDLRKKKKTSK